MNKLKKWPPILEGVSLEKEVTQNKLKQFQLSTTPGANLTAAGARTLFLNTGDFTLTKAIVIKKVLAQSYKISGLDYTFPICILNIEGTGAATTRYNTNINVPGLVPNFINSSFATTTFFIFQPDASPIETEIIIKAGVNFEVVFSAVFQAAAALNDQVDGWVTFWYEEVDL